MGATVGQAAHHARQRGHESNATHCSGQAQLGNGATRQDGRVVQGPADGQVMVEGHGKQDPWLHCREAVDEEHLNHTVLKDDLMGLEPEDAQELGHGGSNEHQVNGSQHGEKVKQGLVEAWVCPNHHEDCEVPQHCHDVHGAEREGDPEVSSLQPRDAC